MKRSNIATIVIILITTILSLIGCDAPKNLANMTSYSTEGTGASNVIEWDGVQYYVFGIGVEHLMDKQIGIINGDKNHRVYGVKNYDSNSWIIEKYHTGKIFSLFCTSYRYMSTLAKPPPCS